MDSVHMSCLWNNWLYNKKASLYSVLDEIINCLRLPSIQGLQSFSRINYHGVVQRHGILFCGLLLFRTALNRKTYFA